MKIAILNYSGNVGKTTIARDLLAYNLPHYEMVSIETVNSDGKESLVIRGDDKDKIMEELLVSDDLILDIGSSNLENFMKAGQKEKEFIQLIDLFIIPVVPDKKQQVDSTKTIADILQLGAKNIQTIYNQVVEDSDFEMVFKNIFDFCEAVNIPINKENIIYRHNLYEKGEALADLIDEADYKSLMIEAKNQGQTEFARECAQKIIHQKKVQSLKSQYQKIFNNLGIKS